MSAIAPARCSDAMADAITTTASPAGIERACLMAGCSGRAAARPITVTDLLVRTRVERVAHFAPPRFQV